MRRTSLIVTAALIALLSVSAAQASCKFGFCVSGSDNNGVHTVDFTESFGNVTHFNYSGPDGQQHELGANQREFSFNNVASGQLEHYSIQACSGGGFLSHSKCTTIADFTHTAP